MDKPFEVGEKVRCIKKGDWCTNAGLGAKRSQNVPVYGGVYTVAFINHTVSEIGEDDNGVEWAMTLEELSEDASTKEPLNVFSCRRFEKA